MKNKLLLALSLFLLVGDCFGQIMFQRVISTPLGCVANAVQQTSDGGYILAANFWDYYQVNSSEVFLIKTNEDGDTVWTKTYNGSYGANGGDGQQTRDGGYIIIGNTVDKYFGNEHIYTIKTNSIGDTLWTKAFGGDSNDVGNSIHQTTDNGYIITGYTESFGAGGQDVYLLKIDVNGDITWSKTYGGNSNDVGYCVKQTSDSGYIVCGTTASFGDSNGVVYLIKTNANGDTLWTKTYGGTNNDVGNSVQQTKDSGYIIAGFSGYPGQDSGDVYLIRTKANGDTLWTKTYGPIRGSNRTAIEITSDSGYIITSSPNNIAISEANVYLIKTNSAGDTLWTKTYGGGRTNLGYSVQQASDGGYIIAGFTDNFSTQFPTPCIYLIKTDANGNSGCNQGTTNTIVGSSATIVGSTQTIVGSGGTASHTATIIGSVGNDSTLCLTVSINELSNNNTISIYPNPAWNELRIRSQGLRIKTIEIFNVLGETLPPFPLQRRGADAIVDISKLATGIYFVRVADEKGSWVGKFVKE